MIPKDHVPPLPKLICEGCFDWCHFVANQDVLRGINCLREDWPNTVELVHAFRRLDPGSPEISNQRIGPRAGLKVEMAADTTEG